MENKSIKTVKYHSYPVFKSLSWVITYHCGIKIDDKFYRLCPDEEVFYLSDLCYEIGCSVDPECLIFEAKKEFTLDGVTYLQIEVIDTLYWTTEQ